MRNAVFSLPASFDVREFLPQGLLLYADSARWLLSTILRKTANRDTDVWGYVRLDSIILRRIMGNHYRDVVRALEEGAIETAPYYACVKCKGYRLAKRYFGDRCARVRAVDPWLLARLEQERQRREAEESQTGWKPIHFLLEGEQRRLTIDPAADSILDGLPERSRLCQDVLVDRLRHREFSFSVSTTGRVFNAITGLKRELRSALRIAGEPVGCIDIVCAQPALLALQMGLNSPANGLKDRETYKDNTLVLPPPALYPPSPASTLSHLTSSVPSFDSLVFSGLLYEFIMDHTGLDRNAVKLAVLRDVLAKRGRYPSVVERTFRQAFPTEYGFIRAVNRNDHAELIRLLQRRESWLVVEQVAPRLMGRVPCITLHDAIYSTLRNLPAVEQAFKEVFDMIGCQLALKREAG